MTGNYPRLNINIRSLREAPSYISVCCFVAEITLLLLELTRDYCDMLPNTRVLFQIFIHIVYFVEKKHYFFVVF